MQELQQKIARVETKVEEHSKSIEKLIDKNDTLIEMKTLLSITIEDSKKRDAQMERFEVTLVKVNENLTNLNSKQELLDERVTGIEGTLSGQNIDTVKLVKGVLSYLATGIGSIAIAYIIWFLTK